MLLPKLCCWNHALPRAGLKCTAPVAPGCQQQDTCVPRTAPSEQREKWITALGYAQ